MSTSKNTWQQKALSLFLVFVLVLGLSPFGTTTLAYADPASGTSESTSSSEAISQESENSTVEEDSLFTLTDAAATAQAAEQATTAQAAEQAGSAQAAEADDTALAASEVEQSSVTLKGFHSAQINSGKLYTYTNGVKGETDLLANSTLVSDANSYGGSMYENVRLAPGDYWVEGFDASGNNNGGCKIVVANAETQAITLHRVYELGATNSGWVKDTDYSITLKVTDAAGNDRQSTIGSGVSNGSACSTAVFVEGDAIEATFTPLGEKAETYIPTTVTKTSTNTTSNIYVTASIPQGISLTITAPAGSTISVGDFSSYYIYKFYDAEETKADATGNVVSSYKIPASYLGQRFYRVQNPNGVTYWKFDQIKESKDITVSADDIHLNDSSFTKDTVYRFDKNTYDVGNIYMNINGEGYMNMNAGETYELNMFRNWQAIDSFFNTKIAVPDMHYQVVDFNGNESDVVSITPDENNSSVATMKAEKAGTAVVLVTYDAMVDTAGQGGTDFSAIWPELTGVFVVSVGADGTSIETNMTMNRATSSATNLDAEHDTLYYLGTEGASYTFTPEEGCTVSVARSTVSNTALSFNGFSTSDVTVDAKTGAVTVAKLTTGRHIIKVEKNGVASYQVINARQATVSITDADGKTIDETNKAKAGQTVTLQFGNLLNPCEKLSGIYNRNTKLTYTGADGATFSSAAGGWAGVYDFAGNSARQKMTVTIPKYWSDEPYTLSTGVLQSSGFGSQPGAHRGLRYATGKAAQTSAPQVGGVLSALPNVSIEVSETQFITGKMVFKDEAGNTIDSSKVSVELTDADGNVRTTAQDGTFTGFAESYSFQTYAAGYVYQTGSVELTENGENVFTVTLASAADTGWDGKTTTEPSKDANGTYLISTGSEMAWFSLQNQNGVAVTGKLVADIDLASYPWNNTSSSSTVATVLDGNGYKIVGLNATNGLFGSVGDASHISNVSVYGSINNGNGSVGGIVGAAAGENTVIESCFNYATFTDCHQFSGGIVGKVTNATVKNCANYGEVSGGSFVGGIAGQLEGTATILSCANKGKVSSGNRTGGIVGSSESAASITNCYNIAAVSGTDTTGGIVGKFVCSSGSDAAVLADCYSTGAITSSGSNSVGGVVGTYEAANTNVSRVYYLDSSASKDPVAQALTTTELKQPEITLSNEGFGLTCDGYPRLTWEDATFHIMGTATSVVAPTCTDKGYSTYKCSRCGSAIAATYVEALGHDFCGHTDNNAECSDCVYTAPTCTQDGSVVQTCRRSGCDETNTVVVPATGHTEDTAQTVAHEGYKTCVCSTCGVTYTVGVGTLLAQVTLPNQGLQAASETLDESYAWAYNASADQIESQNYDKDSTTAKASVTFTFDTDTIVSFAYGVSSERSYDKFTVKQTVGDTTTNVVNAISGENTGTFSARFEANAAYTLSFEYAKDSGSKSGQDKAWISDFEIQTAPVLVEGVTLNASELALGVGESATLSATIAPENAADKTLTWSSDAEAVATVENGVVRAVGAGTAHITVTATEGKTATCEVVVLETSQRGDANNSGKINIVDAQIIYDLGNGVYGEDYAKYPLPAGWNLSTLVWAANVNTDDAVDAVDAFAVQYYVMYGSSHVGE